MNAATSVQAWDELSAREQTLFARYEELFAGMVDNIDQNFGRLMGALEQLGERDNTIVIFTSDNGASREGEVLGTSEYLSVFARAAGQIDRDYAKLDLLGGPQSWPHYPRGWAMAGNTPFRLYKVNTHAGGHQVPFIISWPKGISSGRRTAGAVRPHHRRAPDDPRAGGRGRAGRARGSGRASSGRRELRGEPGGRLGRLDAPRAALRDGRPPRLLPGRLERGHAASPRRAVQRRGVGTLRSSRRPDGAPRPRRRAPREAEGTGRGVGPGRPRQPGLPPRRPQRPEAAAAASGGRGHGGAADDLPRNPDARARSLADADGPALVHGHLAASTTRPATRG